MGRKKLKLFVWEGCFRDYSAGLGVVLAEDSGQARDLLREKIGYDHADLGSRPKEYDLDNPVVFYVCGGG